MPLEFKKAKDVVNRKYARWGIYGNNGVGKTTFLSTIPADLPLLVVNTAVENIKPVADLDHVTVTSMFYWDEMQELFLKLRGILTVRDSSNRLVPNPDIVSGEKKFFRVVAFDTLTRLAALAAKKILGQDNISPEDAYKLMTALHEQKGRNFEFFNSLAGMVGEVVRNFEQLPIHIVWLFQERNREPEFEHSSPTVTGPDLTPAAVAQVKESVELLGRLYVTLNEEKDLLGKDGSYRINASATETRRLLIGQHDRYMAKGPTHILGYTVENPSWDKLAETLI